MSYMIQVTRALRILMLLPQNLSCTTRRCYLKIRSHYESQGADVRHFMMLKIGEPYETLMKTIENENYPRGFGSPEVIFIFNNLRSDWLYAYVRLFPRGYYQHKEKGRFPKDDKDLKVWEIPSGGVPRVTPSKGHQDAISPEMWPHGTPFLKTKVTETLEIRNWKVVLVRKTVTRAFFL